MADDASQSAPAPATAAPADPIANAQFIVESRVAMKPKRYRNVAKLSVGRLFKLMLCWLGMPAALAFSAVFGSAPPALDLWFYAGAAILFLNLSGLVPIRRYSRIEIEDDAG